MRSEPPQKILGRPLKCRTSPIPTSTTNGGSPWGKAGGGANLEPHKHHQQSPIRLLIPTRQLAPASELTRILYQHLEETRSFFTQEVDAKNIPPAIFYCEYPFQFNFMMWEPLFLASTSLICLLCLCVRRLSGNYSTALPITFKNMFRFSTQDVDAKNPPEILSY